MGVAATEPKPIRSRNDLPRLPLKYRILDFANPVVPSFLPILSSGIILENARKESGLSNWGDSYFIEALDALCASIKRDSGLTYSKRLAWRHGSVQRLITRMHVCQVLEENPDILEKKISNPLFVTGLPRTGTSFLHALLAQDPCGRPLLHWEQQSPVPPPDPDHYDSDPRINHATVAMESFYRLFPIFAKIHYIDAKGPDECNGLFLNSFSSNLFFYYHNVPSYIEWYLNSDMTKAYEFYKNELQLLSWKFEDGLHWVLKAPSHLYFLDVLSKVFPDACVIQTHRDPCRVLPSACSLAYHTRKLFLDKIDAHSLGNQWADHLARASKRAIDARAASGSKHFFDINYKDLVADPIATVKRIYDYFGYAWSDAFEENMKRYISENKQHKHGKHRYSLDQFGLDPKSVRQQFSHYCETYREYLDLEPIGD